MSRLLIGLLVYMVGSYLIQYLLGLANGLWGLHLERPQNLFPTNWWLVGQMSRASLIYLMALIALIWLLYRTNLIPRDLFAPRRAAGQANATTTTTVTTGRRRSSRRSATGTSTTTTTHTATSARRAAAARAPATPGTHDLEYGRVRALQRARRRKR